MKNKTKDVLTTSDVAKICRVSTRIVTRWFDKKLLKGYLLPGSTHRRFITKEVESFMVAQGMPAEWLVEKTNPATTIDS